jgi:FixJ family two-component response regulator
MKYHVFIIEDDAALAKSLDTLLASAGLQYIQIFESATGFLNAFRTVQPLFQEPGCLLLDIRMPDMTGAELFHHLKAQGFAWPVIFMTGHGDLSMAVELIKSGAFDYLTKPFDPMGLIQKIQAAALVSTTRIAEQRFKSQHASKLHLLTPHEVQVFLRILNNQTNREIAEQMQNSTRTIENHRATILKKMGATSALELAQRHERFVLLGGVEPFSSAKAKAH